MKKSTGSNKKKNSSKLKIFLPIFLGIVMLAAIPFCLHLLGEYKENRTLAEINGEPVSVKEFKMILADYSSSTYSYFKQKYGVEDSVDFWTKSIGGEVPIDYARKKALEAIARIKIEQSLAKEKGIVKDIAYSSLLKKLEEENKSRREAISKGQVIYGPMKYSEREYFNYVHSNRLIQLKKNLGDNEFKLSEEDRKKFYEANKEKNYKIVDAMTVLYIKTSGVDEKGNPKEDKRNEAKAKMEQLKSRLDKGESFESVSKAYGVEGNVKIVSGERKFDSTTSRSDPEDAAKILEAANRLNKGQISGVVEERDGFYILNCIEKKEGGYRAFEEVKGSIGLEYVDKKFEEMIQLLIKDAKIEVVESLYKNSTLR